MHLPDGFLDAKTAALAAGAAAVGVGLALRQVRSSLEPRQTPMLGLAAAFVFAAQMLNFPVLGGTSGHLMGGVLTAVLLGPAAAILVMTCVLIVQCLMFADGGLLALGANVFNMAVLGVCGGYFVFRVARKLIHTENTRATVFAAAFAGWCATVLASLSCAGQLALSHTVPWSMGFPAMANTHMIIGLGEGLATGLIVMAVLRARPELIECHRQTGTTAPRGLVAYAVLLAVGLAVFVAPFACPWPDGLESVAQALGFESKAVASPLSAPMPDYHVPFFGSATAATAVAGLVGTAVAFIAAYILSKVLVPVLGDRRVLGSPKKDAAGN